uniref:DNA-binding protein n=1 Tax=Strongyloides venezuelensis TaxID=75913 RepID=A0A0K0EUX5_STRVS
MNERYNGPFIIITIDENTSNCELSKMLRSGKISHTTSRGKRIYNLAHVKQLKLYKLSPGGGEIQLPGDKATNAI